MHDASLTSLHFCCELINIVQISEFEITDPVALRENASLTVVAKALTGTREEGLSSAPHVGKAPADLFLDTQIRFRWPHLSFPSRSPSPAYM